MSVVSRLPAAFAALLAAITSVTAASAQPTQPTATADAAHAGASASGAPATGFTRVLRLRAAPHDDHPEVLVHAPPGFDPRGPVNVALYLHGWYGCIAAVVATEDTPCREGGPRRRAQDAIGQLDRAGVNALLVVPQLALDRPSSAPGRLREPNGLRAMLAEVLAHPDLRPVLGAARDVSQLGRVIVFAHSGAWDPVSYVVTVGGVDVHELHLLDALYRRHDVFERWARGSLDGFVPGRGPRGRRLVLIYTDSVGQRGPSRALVRRIARSLPEGARESAVRDGRARETPPPAALARPLVVQRSAVRHAEVPRQYLGALLSSASLPRVAPAAVGGGPTPR